MGSSAEPSHLPTHQFPRSDSITRPVIQDGIESTKWHPPRRHFVPERGIPNKPGLPGTWGKVGLVIVFLSPSAKGVVELDFIDFDRSQATVGIRPRLRLLGIEKAFLSGDTIFLGQDWDILAMSKPFTYNFVGLYFRSGNVGFLRPQIRYTHFAVAVKALR